MNLEVDFSIFFILVGYAATIYCFYKIAINLIKTLTMLILGKEKE